MIVDNLAAYSNPVAAENSAVRSPAVAGPKPTADYNTFLKLLIAQMKNQDPTQPSDPTKYISQLASFSALEESTQTNKKLDALNTTLGNLYANSFTAQAASYIGKHVETTDDAKVKIEGNIKSIKICLDGLIAVLDNGSSVLLGPGVTISDPVAKHGTTEKKTLADPTHKLVG
ncbi:flagellar hook assembly protein FlgD [Bartonella sp. TP]|uniref:flagellar hook assembly protein FlgD n=1 Tax=Bartonella sp. TP TaxID=3057550 RepID=UPI0025B27F45|nr:flagellar hook assembly protein FlgD [Bartonella sp. TP]MDN5249014.1 flagellar hook assembly protein FlgD [Alphaproteobacteria bacterium]WJW80257.1 flagellar hook assembly protein FlgD [Bartonella sp. TP]